MTKLSTESCGKFSFIILTSSAQERLDENLKTLKAQVELKLSGDTSVTLEGYQVTLLPWIIIIL